MKRTNFAAQILCIQSNVQSISTDNLSCFHRRRGGGGGCRLFCVFSLVFAQSSKATLGPSLYNLLAVLIHLQFHNDNFGWMDTNWNCSSISFLTLDPLNVDHKLLTVALDDFANLLSFVVTTYNLNFIVLADRDVSDVVLLFKFFGERSRHQLSADVGRCTKMTLAILAARRSYSCVQLHSLSVEVR